MRLFLSLILVFAFPVICFGALDADIVWEVRSGGSSDNGGGFNSGGGGTDWSQADAAKETQTDGACADHTGPTYTFTSAAASFSTDDVGGNLIYISDTGDGTHFTIGWYEVESVNSDTSVELDSDPTDGTNEVGGDYKLGGGTDHPNTISAILIAGNIIYIEDGVYQPVGADTFVLDTSVDGTSIATIKWIGYKAARTTTPTGDDRPNFDANSVVGSDVLRLDDPYNLFYNIIFENAADNGFEEATAASDKSHFWNCRFTNNSDRGVADNNERWYVNCEFDNNTQDGFNGMNSQFYKFLNGYLHDNSSEGINADDQQLLAIKTISESNSSHGITTYSTDQDENLKLIGCVAYNNTGAATSGFHFGTTYAGNWLFFILNCTSSSNGQYAFSNAAANGSALFVFDYNNYFGHATELNNITAGEHDTGDSDPKFTLPGAGDFTYQSGSPCLDAASNVHDPTTGVTGDYKTNIGCDQDDVAAAAAGPVANGAMMGAF